MNSKNGSPLLSETLLAQSRVTIRPIAMDDGGAIAGVHAEIFPDSFLTHLGLKILTLFYQEFVDNPVAFGYVAVRDAQIVGFVAGLLNPSSFYGAFYRKNFGNLFVAVAASSIRDRSFNRDLGKRSKHIFYALRSRFKLGKNKNIAMLSAVPARLLSIGVLPAARGMGIAHALVDQLGQEFSRRGVETMGLSVFASNECAIAFYRKNGWQCELDNGDSLYFIKPTGFVVK